MQPVATVVAFGPAPARAAARLDATALACDLIADSSDLFPRIKRAEAGSLVFLLTDAHDDPALAAAAKAASILRRRGSGPAILVPPPVPSVPGPQARARLHRAADLTQTCVVQPVGGASWSDAVRCFAEPLAVFGLVGVERREIFGLVHRRAALLQLWNDESLEVALRGAREVLVSCRLRPTATLGEVDDAAHRVRAATSARLVLAGPEVTDDDGPRAICASFF